MNLCTCPWINISQPGMRIGLFQSVLTLYVWPLFPLYDFFLIVFLSNCLEKRRRSMLHVRQRTFKYASSSFRLYRPETKKYNLQILKTTKSYNGGFPSTKNNFANEIFGTFRGQKWKVNLVDGIRVSLWKLYEKHLPTNLSQKDLHLLLEKSQQSIAQPTAATPLSDSSRNRRTTKTARRYTSCSSSLYHRWHCYWSGWCPASHVKPNQLLMGKCCNLAIVL